MALHDTEALILETATAAESLPDPVLFQGRTHILINTGFPAAAVWSSVGALPFNENGVNVATISVPPGTHKTVGSDGVRWIVFNPAASGLLAPTVTTPVRAFNTTYSPSLSRPVLVLASVEISCTSTLSLLSADDGQVNLVADLGAPATIRASVRNRNLQTLGLLVGSQQLIRYEMSFLLPAGWSYRLNTVSNVAAPTFSLINVVEEVL